MKSSRSLEVITKLNKMFKGKSEDEKDNLVKTLKCWLKCNPNTEDLGKIEGIKCFLAENCIY